jgi:hypothetical protein
MGMMWHMGAIPSERTIFPTGIHNMIPYKLRQFIPTYDHSLTPWGWWMDHEITTMYYLGDKAFPDQIFTSNRKKVYKAIINKDFTALESLLNNGFNLNEIVLPDFGYTALGLAASLDSIEMVHYLTIRGADLEQLNGPFKKTALHLAVEFNSELTTKFLLNKGADINAKDGFGFTVHEKAENRGFFNYKKIFEYFTANPKQRAIKNYEEFLLSREIKIDKLESFNENDFPGMHFNPSNLIELSNIYSIQSQGKEIDMESFSVSFINLYDINKINNTI